MSSGFGAGLLWAGIRAVLRRSACSPLGIPEYFRYRSGSLLLHPGQHVRVDGQRDYDEGYKSEISRMLFSRGLAEIVLIVKDVKASARFYREVVGLMPATEPDDEWAWFWAGPPGEAQRVALHTGALLFEDQSPLPGGKRWGPVHYALQVPPDKLQAAADHVRGQGVEVSHLVLLLRPRWQPLGVLGA